MTVKTSTRWVAALAALGTITGVFSQVPPSSGATGRCGNPAERPWCNTKLSPDERAGLLLAALTEDEKISLLGGDDTFFQNGHTGTSDGIERVGLPPVYYTDGPAGIRQGSATAPPIPMALAATWDPNMAFRYGGLVGNEAKFKGNDVVFGPMVNLVRTPLAGRTFEGYGEDPYLESRMAVRWIEGAQGQGVIANVKHYAANNQEGYAGPVANLSAPGQPLGPPPLLGDRFTVNAVVDERTLHEIYLPHFEAAVKEGHVGSVMCAYNRVNGQYACENEHLLNDILKRQWGFEGYVLADYGAAHNTVAELNNGLDFEPWPGISYSPPPVRAALAASLASPADVDDHVRRILRTLFAFGFFDRPAYDDDDNQIDKRAHARTAREIEEAAITLLKNDGALPLDARKLKSIAVIGADADTFKTGGGSSTITPFSYTTPRQAIADRAGSHVRVEYDDGSDAARAAALAKGSDVAIVFVGDYETEGSDRYCLTLECPMYNGDQDGLVEEVAAAQPNTIVVLETGGPVLTPWRGTIKALVEAWYPGQEGGTAIARVLFGDVDPGGRLPITFPEDETDLPTAGDPEKYPGVAENAYYKEGVFVGYRWYDRQRLAPAYPFGFGLSYTSFRFRNLRIERAPKGSTAKAIVSVEVTNTGRRRGAAVPQLYLAFPSSPAVPQPVRQLKGFGKVTLSPGTSARVRFTLDERAFSYWDVHSNGWRVAPGCYGVDLGISSRRLFLHGTIARGGARCGPGAVRI